MKTSNSTMPKSINSKKNGQHQTGAIQTRVNTSNHNNKFLKELSGQVVVSVEKYKSNPDLFIGNLRDGLRLKDGREVIVACEIEGMAFPLDKVADLLLNCILINFEMASANVNSDLTVQSYPLLARAYKFYCTIMDFLNPGHKSSTLEFMRQYNKDLYSLLKAEGSVNYFGNINRRDYEKPENPSFCFGKESIDAECLAYMVALGAIRINKIIQDEEIDDEMDRMNIMFTAVMGGIMAAKLRRMKRKAAIEYAAKELGPGSKGCVEVVFKMLTIDKEEVGC